MVDKLYIYSKFKARSWSYDYELKEEIKVLYSHKQKYRVAGKSINQMYCNSRALADMTLSLKVSHYTIFGHIL